MSKIFRNALFETKERESAVSPVVGVMLMLVVTIIIAATVSAFAGGLVGSADKAPQATFEVKISTTLATWSVPAHVEPTMTITHLGGDPIDTARTKIVTTWTNRTTREVNFRDTTALPYNETAQIYNTTTGSTVHSKLLTANANQTLYKFQDPYLVIPGDMPADDSSLWFGNYILHAGEVMKAQSSLSSYKDYSPNGYNDYSLIKNAELLSSRDVVNVKLIDIPTGTVIYDHDIYVMEV